MTSPYTNYLDMDRLELTREPAAKGTPCWSSSQSLTKTYRAAEVETTALHDVNVDIGEGEFVAIMGPSGCGKSTLLNVIGMLDSPTVGHLPASATRTSAGYAEAQLAGLRKRHIGFVFQSFNLIDELTVEGNIELALLYQRRLGRRAQAAGRARRWTG